jgi:hypothetical protein
MDRPNYVWEKSWQWLCDGILYKERHISQNQGKALYQTQPSLNFKYLRAY